jgi:hypothetical protein
MKTITTILSTVILLISQMVVAQSKSDKMYDTFANKDGISSFSFSKNMIDAINLDLGENGEEKRLPAICIKYVLCRTTPKKAIYQEPNLLKK